MVLISIILTAALAFDGPDLLTITKHYEGFKAQPYLCPAGVWTIGYGHTEGVSRNSPPVNKEEAEQLLIKDLTEAAVAVIKHAGPALSQSASPEEAYRRLVALASWTFNLGEGNLSSSTMLKRIRVLDWDAAANEMLRWDKATVGGRTVALPGLTKRRKTEAHYFRTGKVLLF